MSIVLAQENWSQAADVLRDKLELLEDEGQQREVYTQLAELMDGRLEDAREAITHLQSALDVEPENTGIFERLCGLYEREGLWQDLMDLLEQQQGLSLKQEGRADEIDIRIAEILRDKMADLPQAVERLGEVLERNGDNAQALRELEDLLSDETIRLSVCRILERHYSERVRPSLPVSLKLKRQLRNNPTRSLACTRGSAHYNMMYSSVKSTRLSRLPWPSK